MPLEEEVNFQKYGEEGLPRKILKIDKILSQHRGKRPILFVFSGMGSQWKGMGRDLLKFEIFEKALREPAAALQKAYGFDLYSALDGRNGKDDTDNVLVSFVTIVAVQIGLLAIVRTLGIRPDHIVGHSVGEICCGVADDCLTSTQALKLAYVRGQVLLAQSAKGLAPVEGDGAMASVGLFWENMLARCPPAIVAACHNSKNNTTISGPAGSVRNLVQILEKEDIFVRMVNSAGFAFHSPCVAPCGPQMKQLMEQIVPSPKRRTERWLSTSIQESKWDKDDSGGMVAGADYFVTNFVSPVLFTEALGHVPQNAVVIELAPHGLLQSILKQNLGPKAAVMSLTDKKAGNQLNFLFESLGKIFNTGVTPDFGKLYNKNIKFPVSMETPMISPLVQWDHRATWAIPRFPQGGNQPENGRMVQVSIDKKDDSFYAGHRIEGRIIFPFSGYVVLVWETLSKMIGRPFHQTAVVLEDFQVKRATIMEAGIMTKFSIKIVEETGEFFVLESGSVVACGLIRIPAKNDPYTELLDLPLHSPPISNEVTSIMNPLMMPLNRLNVYKELRLRGYEYSGMFKGVEAAANDAAWGKVAWRGNWTSFLDTAFHIYLLSKKGRGLRLPIRVKKAVLDPHTFLVHHNLQFDDNQGGKDTEIAKFTGPPTENDNNLVSMSYYKDLDVLKCPGLEFRQITTKTVARKPVPPEDEPVLEDYSFTKYFDDEQQKLMAATESSTVLPSQLEMALENERGLQYVVNLAVENTPGSNIKILAIVARDNNEEDVPQDQVISNLLCEIVQSQVHKKFKIILMTPAVDKIDGKIQEKDNRETSPQATAAAATASTGGMVERVQLSMEAMMEFVAKPKYQIFYVDDHQMDKFGLGQIIQKFPLGALVVYRSNGMATATTAAAETGDSSVPWQQEGLTLLARKICRSGRYMLFRKSRQSTSESQDRSSLLAEAEHVCIEITCRDYDWVEEVKMALKASATSSLEGEEDEQRIYLFSQNEPLNGIIGLVNCLRHEPGSKNLRCFFLIDPPPPDATDVIFDLRRPTQFLREQMRRDLLMNVYWRDAWGSYSFLKHKQNESQIHAVSLLAAPHRVHTSINGDLSSLCWTEKTEAAEGLVDQMKKPKEDTTMVTVHYASIGELEVLQATGKFSTENEKFLSPCTEFSGTDDHGNRVIGVINGETVSTHLMVPSTTTKNSLYWPVPTTWTLRQAATVPLAYSMAFHALIAKGQLKMGQSMLVHCGVGPIGQAVVRIAASMKCKIFMTVRGPEERQKLKILFPHMFLYGNADSIEELEDGSFVQSILKRTSGHGVNLVLNYLNKIKIKESIDCLDHNGHFVQMGEERSDFFSEGGDNFIGYSVISKGIKFSSVHLDTIFDHDNGSALLHSLVTDGIESGVVQPIEDPVVVFRQDQLTEAFRHATNSPFEKVLLEIRRRDRISCFSDETKSSSENKELLPAIRRRPSFESKKVHIIVGGLGGAGLEVAAYLIENGARKLVLVSRSGVSTGYQSRCLRQWVELGVEVTTPTHHDVTTWTGAESLLGEIVDQHGPGSIGGIFNLAMVIEAGLMDGQTGDKFRAATLAKIDATQWLDRASQKWCPGLKYFVCFSSVNVSRGNVGLTSYGFGNSAMERICEERHKKGLPGLAIQWGPLADVGVIADRQDSGQETQMGSCVPQSIRSWLKTLDLFLQRQNEHPILAATVIDKNYNSSTTNDMVLDSHKDIGNYLVGRVADILGMRAVEQETENDETTLADLGLDSLMAVEVKVLLEKLLGSIMPLADIRVLTLSKIRGMGDSKKISEESNDHNKEEESSLSDQNEDNLNNDPEDASTISKNYFNYESFDTIKAIGMEPPDSENDDCWIPKNVLVNLRPRDSTVLDRSATTPSVVVFFVHLMDDSVSSSLCELAKGLKAKKVYGLQCTPRTPTESVEKMAAFYIEQIQLVQPHGPYNLVGYCYGCLVALEITRQLETQGEAVRNLIFLDGSHKTIFHKVNGLGSDNRLKLNRDQSMGVAGRMSQSKNDSDILSSFICHHLPLNYDQVSFEMVELTSFEEKLSKITELFVHVKPQVCIETAKEAANSFYKRVKAFQNYNQPMYIMATPVLIKARDSLPDSDLSPDYWLSEVSWETVKVHSVPGDHNTFLELGGVGDGGGNVKHILNWYLASDFGHESSSAIGFSPSLGNPKFVEGIDEPMVPTQVAQK